MGYALPSVEYEELDSRKQNMKDLKKALEDSSATVVGVHGLAGMGKTTLVIKAINTVQSGEAKLFDHVVMANVTKSPDIRKIQGQIADMLGMTLQEESEYARAIRIRENLKKGKNTLIILDDMYAKVDLDMLGISSQSGDDKKNLILKQGIKSSNPSGAVLPREETNEPKMTRQKSAINANRTKTDKRIEDTSGSSSKVGKAAQENQKGCKVLLISETRRVLKQMDVNANSIIFVDFLNSDDAKKLFKKKVEITEEKNSDLERLAIDIAKKCNGLPMSIVTTAKALKGQSPPVWEETLKTLERQKHTGTPEYSTELSYELLANEDLKLMFLLCACMGQDTLVADLVRLCIGLGFLEGVYTAREARDQVQMLLMHLKESGLLSDSYSNDRFTMQNLIRNAALSIASKNNVFVLAKRKLDEWPDEDKLERYTSIFLHHCDVNTEEFPESLKCPKLKVFRFHNNHQHFKIPKDFFQEMKELRVLVLIGIDLSQMSSSMECLTKLRKLCLEQCIHLDEELCKNIGKLKKNLRILSFSGSDIKSLPIELKDLSKLQILDLSNCSELKKIPPLLISSLTSLEELYMRNTLVEWRIDNNRQNNKNKNASLSELGNLNQITNVDLKIPSVAHLPKNLFFDKLYSYKIVIGSSSTHLEPDFKMPEKYELLRYLAIQEKDGAFDIHSQKGIKMLFERVENLLLEELNGVQDIFYALNLKGFPCLKTLSIASSCGIRSLIKPQERKHPENAFPKLETLHLYKLNNMEQLCFCESLSASSFRKLKVVKIKLCGLLKNVFLISMVKLLVVLEIIEVSECNSLKEIVCVETNPSERLVFQELRTLTLKSLPEFHGFYRISSTVQQKILFDEQVGFSKLERLELSSIQIHQIWTGQNPPFAKLVHLEVNGCGNLENLLSLSMARNMLNLQSISVSECDNMKCIFFKEQGSSDTRKKVTIFPNLKNIKVSSMKTLSGICNGFEFPIDSFGKLETLVIDECDKLGYVFTSHVGIFQYVSNLRVTNCKSIKAIFDPAWENKPAASEDATTNLQDVHLESLPKLEHVFRFNRKKNQHDGILSLNNLHKIWVQDCERLENIFSVSVTRTLEKNLEDLMVSDCSHLREIVAKEDVNRKISSLSAFNFLKLATIKFLRLPKFKSFYPGTKEIKFPALNNLSIEECEKLEPFREEIIDAQSKPILFPETVINNLKSIQIESRHATSSTNYDYRRDNLEELHLSKLKDTKILYSFLHSNPNMKNLWLNDCSFEELVPLERLANIESLGVVPQLKSLKLTDLPNLRRIGFERDPILQMIESLVFQNCPILKTIAPCNVFLSHLTKLEVVDCERLEYLMSPSTARSLGKLNTMKVINCESLKEIVSEKGQGRKAEDHKDKGDIIFKQLGTIELVSLKHLKSFCSSKSCAFQFPTLEKFVVSACPKLKSFSQQEGMNTPMLQKIYVVHEKEKMGSYWTNNLQQTIQYLFKNKMFFEGMEEVSVSDHLAHLQQLWQSKGVGQQENVFKKGLPEELFNNLKTLKLSGCGFEPYAIPSNVLFTFKNLKELEVDNCEKITGIFEMNDTKMMGTLFQLKKLTLEALPNVTHVWQPKKKGILSFKNLQIVTVNECKDLRTLFPIALARDLKKLEELDVRECDELSNIVEAVEAGTDEHLVFPCLTTLALCYLPSLTDFCSQKFTLECPELSCFEVYDCNDQLEIFQSQQEENQNSTSTTKQPLFMNTKDILKMEILTLNWRHTQTLSSWLRKFKDENLESLNELYLVDDDEQNNSNVPSELFKKTPNLETLYVRYYYDETLKNILPSHDDEANNNKEILGNLKELYLSDLDELQSISGVENLSKQLRLLDVSDCPKLTTILLQFSSNVKELHIDSCEALLRLFTSSTARMLIHLEELEVENCKSLKEIVGEEQHSATTEDGVIEFKQLERITLRSLESLECFYSGNATLKLPSLIQLDIADCSKMNVFSHGIVSVSRRIQVSYNSSDNLVFHQDLNAAAVWQFLSQERIVLRDVLYLREIWAGKVPIPVDCPSCKFQYLEVDGYDFLSDSIIPSHLLPLLTNLEELVVRNCDSVEAIFDVRVRDTPTSDSSTRVIPLKKLTLERLPILRHVWNNDPNKGGLSFPCLEEVTSDECKRIKNLFPASIAGDNLRELDVGNCEEMEEIVAKDANKELIKFHKLAKLTLFNLPKLRYVISSMMDDPEGCEISSNALLPSHLLSSLNDLKELVVIDCDSIEAIFDVKYSSPTQDPNMIDIPLKTIILENLPTLRHVWNDDPKGGFRLLLLNEVIVKECKCITNLFPASVFINKVRKLDVRNCVKLEEIVGKDEAITAGKENDEELLMFPCLTTLTLWELPALRCIWSGMRILDWPELKELDVYHCPKLKMFAADSEISPYSKAEDQDGIATNDRNDDANEGDNDDGDNNDNNDSVVSPSKMVAPCLQRLSLNKEDIRMIDQGQLQVDLQNILFLKLQSFHDEIYSFPDDFISKIQLTAIEQIAVVDSGFQQIFNSQRPELDTENYTKILSQLKGLVLRDLYKLESIGFEQTWMAPLLENLEHLKILACNCLMNLAPSTVSFSKLTQLNVKDCARLEYLFTSSTANSFAELKRMSISNCELLETVMVGDGDNDNEDVTFPKLSFIYLGNLPKLESFFKGKPNLNFPKLHKVFITECKGMQTFYQGNVVSPELQGVKDTKGEFLQIDDLNTAIKHYLRGEEGDSDSTKQEKGEEKQEDDSN